MVQIKESNMNFWFFFNLTMIVSGVLFAFFLLRPESKNQSESKPRLSLIDKAGRLVFAAVLVTIGWVGFLLISPQPTQTAVDPTPAPVEVVAPVTPEPIEETPPAEPIEEVPTAQPVDDQPTEEASVNPKMPDRATLISACEAYVREKLDAPRTAKFANMLEKMDQKIIREGTFSTYGGFVDHDNGFGGEMRTNFLCLHDTTDDMLQVQLLE
jgi:type IV secretory pathway VirB10-like protein